MYANRIVLLIMGLASTLIGADSIATSSPPVVQGTINQGETFAIDAVGNRYITGNFIGTLDFNPGSGVDTKTSAGSNDAFVTRINADGSYGWTQTFGGIASDNGYGVSTDGTSVYVAGYFQSTNAQIGAAGFSASTVNGTEDVFVIALNCSDGAPKNGWGLSASGIQTFGGTNTDLGYGVATDGTSVYVTGFIQSTNAQIGTTGTGVGTAGNKDAFAIALNCSDGAAKSSWGLSGSGIQTFGGTNIDIGNGVTTDCTSVYVTGNFFSANAQIGATGTAVVSAGNDAFVIALNCSNGAAKSSWGISGSGIQTFGGTDSDVGSGVATDGASVYITGPFQSVNAQIGAAGTMVGSAGSSDAFVVALNCSDGAAKSNWGRSGSGFQTFGGTGADGGFGLATDGASVYITGYFQSADAQLAASGTTVGSNCAFIIALNCSNGAAKSSWGLSGSGIQTFGGTNGDIGYGVTTDSTCVYVHGKMSSTDAGVGGLGSISVTGFNGFLLGLDKSTGASIFPIFTSPLSVAAGVGTPFNYTFSATSSPTVYGAVNLPAGLSYGTGKITGTPTVAGTYPVIISATNAAGTSYATLTITVISDAVANIYPPVVQGNVIQGENVAVDASGNRYITGVFSGTVDFNPGPGVDAKSSAGGSNDAFVTRFNGDGSYGWTQTFGGTSTDVGTGVATDGTTLFVTGHFSSTNAQIGTTGATVGTAGGQDAFVIALNCSDGTAKSSWGLSGSGIQTFGGTNFDLGTGVATDGTTVFVTGGFNSSNAQIGEAGTAVGTAGSNDAFVMALNTSDGLAKSSWGLSGSGIQTFGGTSDDAGYGVATDGTTVFVTGYFYSTNAKIGGAGTAAGSAGSGDAFVIALNASNGAASWGGIQTFRGTSNDVGTGVATDGTTVFVTGYFQSTDAKIGGAGTAVGTAGSNDAFVIALNASNGAANSSWGLSGSGIQTFGGTGSDVGHGVATDGTTVFVTGYFSFSAQIGAAGTAVDSVSGTQDAFVMALNATDGLAKSSWGLSDNGIQTFGGTGIDVGYGLATDGTTVFAHGNFSSNNAGVGGIGNFKSSGFGGFLLGLNKGTGTSALSIITSPLSVIGGENTPFTYTFSATGSPTGYGAFNLPAGLSYAAGVITGTPTKAGIYAVTLSVTNAAGTSYATLTITVKADSVANVHLPVVQGIVNVGGSVAIDASGNRYIAGTFNQTVDFNPGLGVDVHSTAGSNDVFVTRFNADGSYAWSQTFGGTGNDIGYGVATDGTTVFVSGEHFSTNAQIGGAGTAVGTAGSHDAFVIAVNCSNGAAKSNWGRSGSGIQTFGGTGFDRAYGVATDGMNVFVTGEFSSTNTQIGAAGTAVGTGNQDAFVIALNVSNGAAKSGWGLSGSGIQTFGGTGGEFGIGVTTDGTSVFVTGQFNSVDARIGAAGTAVGTTTAGYSDAFVIALNVLDGAAKSGWGRSGSGIETFGGGSNLAAGYGVATDGTTVFATGFFNSTNAQIGGAGTAVGTAGSNDAFVMALNTSDGTAKSGWGLSGSGIHTFGGSDSDQGFGVATDGTTVFVTGISQSTNAQISAAGTAVGTAGDSDAFVIALNASDGAAKSGWGLSGSGIQTFGGSGSSFAVGNGVATDATNVFVHGFFSSSDAGVGGIGYFDSTGFLGFLLELDKDTGTTNLKPIITSPLTVAGVENTPFTYTFSATGSPTGYGAFNLPAGLSYAAGAITGTPTKTGTYHVIVSATNVAGTTYATLTITVNADAVASVYPPVVQGIVNQGGNVAIDVTGNHYVTGSFTGTLDFNPGPGVDIKKSAGLNDAFITRFNADGSYAWTQTFGGEGDDHGYGVVTDGTSVYVVGQVQDTNAQIGASGLAVKPVNGSADAFVIALNCSNGAAKSGWGRSGSGIQTFGGSNIDIGNGVATDGTSIYVTGQIQSADAQIGGAGTSVGTAGSNDAFVVALNSSDGMAKSSWGLFGSGIQTFGGTNVDTGNSVATDGTNVYITGEFQSTNARIGATGTAVGTAGSSDAFVVTLNCSNGAAKGSWGLSGSGIQTFGGTSFDNSYGMTTDGTSLYVTGSFQSSNAQIGAAGTTVGSAGGNLDAFVIAINCSDGAAKASWGLSGSGIQTFGGTSHDIGNGVVTDGTSVYVTGYYQGSAQIGAAGMTVATAGNKDAFLIALNASDGAAKSAWGRSGSGIQTFGGTSQDIGYAVALGGTSVFIHGSFISTDAGVGGIGYFDSTGFSGFLLELNKGTGTSIPNLFFTFEGSIGGQIYRQVQNKNFTVKITARDASGQRLSSFNGPVIISSTGTLSQGSGSTANFVNGVLTSHIVKFSNSGSFVLRATEASDSVGVSNVFEVVPAINSPPVISEGVGPIAHTMDEDGSPSAFSLTLNATDADGDTITWTISGAAAHGTATASGTGLSKVIGYMPTANYNGTDSFTVQVSDGLGGTDTIVVNVTIDARNDAPAISPQSFTLAENSANGTAVGTVVASDVDAGQTLSFAITAGNTGNAFAINANTGQLTVNATSALDFELTPQFSLTVQVTDNHSTPLSGSATVTINLTNVNEAPSIQTQTFSIAENSGSGTAVGTIVASDVDAGQTLSFSITAGNTYNAFAINPSTGQLTVTGLAFLDYENRPQYNLTVQVTDNDGSPLSASATITVNLTDLNEAPFFDPPDATESIAENSPAGTQVAFLFVGDVDEGQKLTLAIIAGNTGNAFELKPTAVGYDLDLRVANPAALDYETNKQFTLTVQVTDDHNPPLSATTTLIINLTDVNDAPVITAQTFSLPENSANGTVVGTVSASDSDAGQSLSYTITAGNTNNAFAIDSSTGQITVATASALNFESTPSFSLVVQVTDNGGTPVSSSATVTVKLTDVGEAPSITSAATASVTTAGVGQTVTFSVGATDPTGAVSITWDFGDTILGSGASTTHSYTAPGVYNVKTIVSNAAGIAVQSSLTLTVVAPQFGTGSDSDGDGFSDELEVVAGSNPFSALESPVGSAAAAPPLSLELLMMAIKLNFSMPGKDVIQIAGALPVPPGFSVTGQRVTVDVGGVLKTFVLDDKGKSPKANDIFKITVKAKKGVVSEQIAKFQLNFKKGDFDDTLADEGLTGTSDATNVTRSVRVDVIFNQGTYRKDQSQSYNAKRGKRGAAKIPR